MATVSPVTDQQPGISVSWQAASLAWQRDGVMQQQAGAFHDVSQLPVLSDSSLLLQAVCLPIEMLLVRHISLPLPSPKLVDADMLFQTLADSCEVDTDACWLSWDLRSCEQGVAGMLFALPETLRASMQEDRQWSAVTRVVVDAYERVQPYVHQDACLVLDQDTDGVCFGVYDGQAWRGVRRLNGPVDKALAKQLWLSASAMGFQDGIVCGRVGSGLKGLLASDDLCWQADVIAALPSRHEANLACMHVNPALNLRHGSWSASPAWRGQLGIWKRSVILLSLLLLSWLVNIGLDLHRMDTQIAVYSQRVEAAFHAGLPDAPVMLDALAQLRQAAGSHLTSQPVFLLNLQAIARVYKSSPWQLKLLELRDGAMYMAGTVKDIKSLNHIQRALAHVLMKQVRISDTNISKKSVSFRMYW